MHSYKFTNKYNRSIFILKSIETLVSPRWTCPALCTKDTQDLFTLEIPYQEDCGKWPET